MTLLETLVALSLLSILLMFIFGIFRQLTEVGRMSELAQKRTFQMRYLESRLAFLFERVVNENDKSRQFFFYSAPPQASLSRHPALVFTFYNEVRRDPYFSGDLLAKLYVDQAGRLKLATWPLFVAEAQLHDTLHEEVLFENVAFIQYRFYAAPEKLKSSRDVVPAAVQSDKKKAIKGVWQEDWSFDYAEMPSIIEIKIGIKKPVAEKMDAREAQEELLDFRFVLPSSKNEVYYPPGSLSG